MKKLEEKYRVIDLSEERRKDGEEYIESYPGRYRCQYCCRKDYCNNYLIQAINNLPAYYDRPWLPFVGQPIPKVHGSHCPALVNRTPWKDAFYRKQRIKYGFKADLPEVLWENNVMRMFDNTPLYPEGKEPKNEEELARIENEIEQEKHTPEFVEEKHIEEVKEQAKNKKTIEAQVTLPMDIRQQKEVEMKFQYFPVLKDDLIMIHNWIHRTLGWGENHEQPTEETTDNKTNQ